jgi:metal-sulfur cluster biosynthetic enzyme
MTPEKILEDQVIMVIKTIEDPEIPVNIYELGLIYFINITKPPIGRLTKLGKLDRRFKANKGGVKKGYDVNVEMTLTSPNCPVAESMPEEVRVKVENLEMVNKSSVTITWDPTWDKSFMSEEAKLELGML